MTELPDPVKKAFLSTSLPLPQSVGSAPLTGNESGMEYLHYLSELCDKQGLHSECEELECKCGCHPRFVEKPDPSLLIDYP